MVCATVLILDIVDSLNAKEHYAGHHTENIARTRKKVLYSQFATPHLSSAATRDAPHPQCKTIPSRRARARKRETQ